MTMTTANSNPWEAPPVSLSLTVTEALYRQVMVTLAVAEAHR
jgi:hypothetical protein